MDQPPKSLLRRPIGKPLLLLVIVFYLLICIVMAVVQRSLLYYPHVYTPAQVDKTARKANLERWTNSSGENIGLKRLSPEQPAAGSILISYGNGSTAVGCAGYANE